MNIDSMELMTNVTTTLIEDTIKGAWSKVKKYFIDLNAKDEIEYGFAYEEYLINTKRKNSKIKTIIYRRSPQDLYKFYECIGVSYNGKTINTNSILNIIEIDSKIIITGTGGIGKSTMFKHFFLNTIDETNYIPVLLELRSFNNQDAKEISLYNAIYNNLIENGFTLSEDHFKYSMEKGGYIIFLDGYDEVNREKEEKISNEIKSISSKYNDNKFIVSSRPNEGFIGWNDFAEMTSLDLTKEQALSLISKIDFDESVKSVFSKQLDDTLYDKYESFASNPLLLNIMLLTFHNHASIPERLNDFYEEAFTTLFNMHDATKDSYVRDIRTGLSCEDFKLIFSYMCFKSYFKGEYEFTDASLRNYLQQAKEKFDRVKFSIGDFQDDLTMSVCMLVKEGLNYRFSHRSFQEYFAAWYTCKLTDDTQSRLLSAWIKDSPTMFSDSYFPMLFNFQSEKVNKIVLVPILRLVETLYKEKGFTVELLRELFEGVSIRKSKDENDNPTFRLSLNIKNTYLCHGLILNNRLNNYNISTEETISDKIKELAQKLTKNKQNPYRTMTFDTILEVTSQEELLEMLSWFERHIVFASNTIEKYETSSINRKRKVSSIIDEL